MAKKSTQKKKAPAKTAAKKTVKKATVKPVAKQKKVVKKVAVKSKPAKKSVAKKTVAKKVSSKPVSKVKKIVAKPKLTAKKKVVKVQPKKKAVKALPKKKINKVVSKIAIKKQNISKKPVKKIVSANVKPAPEKHTAKKLHPKAKEAVKKALPKVVEKKIFHNPKIVSVKNVPGNDPTFNRADMFYKNLLKAISIKRYFHYNEEDKEFVTKDQNLSIEVSDRETRITISEKSREQDWNDIHVEIFREYPHEEGWIKYTEAEYLAYFFPGRVFWAKMEPIKILCQDILSKAVDSGIYKELFYMFPKNSGRLSKTFKINQKTYSFNFILTYHEGGENSYYSIGLSLPFVLLMDFRIDYKIFKQ